MDGVIDALKRGGIRPFEVRISRNFATGFVEPRNPIERINLGQLAPE